MADTPAKDMSGVLTGTGFLAYLEAQRRHEMEQYDALHEAAVRVRRGIIRYAKGRQGMMGIDVRIAARKITRPMHHAADMHLQAAKALSMTAQTYLGTLGVPAKAAPRSFDPTR